MSTAEALDVAIIQTELVWQDAAANRELLQPLLWQASGADLIILPETFNGGFSMQVSKSPKPCRVRHCIGCSNRRSSSAR